MNDLITQGGTAVALPADYLASLAQDAADASATETPSISTISFKSGILAVGGTPVPGNAMNAIVVSTAFENCLYDGAYDPKAVKSPICYALSEDGEEMVPHPDVVNPIHPTCKGCPKLEWKSAGEGRNGKACKEIRRLILIPSDKLQSVDEVKASEVAMAKVPVTSVKNWSNYVHSVRALHSLPYWAGVTKMSVKPHIKNQFEVVFELAAPINNMELLEAIKEKRKLTTAYALAPYSGSEETPTEAPAAETKKSKKF